MRHLLCLLTLFATLTATEAKERRSCRIVFLGAPADAPKKLYLFDGKDSQEIELPSMNFSPVYPLRSGAIPVKMLPANVSNPKKVSPDAPGVDVPAEVTDFYLIVTSDPENQIAPVKLAILDATHFPKGRLLWSNHTGNSLEGTLGTEKLELGPNSTQTVNAPASKNKDYDVILSFRMPNDERLRPLCETKWRYVGDGRTVVFVVEKQGERIPRVMAISDDRESARR